ncbi:hypothetical protein VNO78_18495 [Psophocarpus tetragonolobus]|uniref:Uncharacterized protein n=1 Tax=Psophocarpus tetragonolobus TaxID=3891 RepID=A0AAN9SJK0_PSOTE
MSILKIRLDLNRYQLGAFGLLCSDRNLISYSNFALYLISLFLSQHYHHHHHRFQPFVLNYSHHLVRKVKV